MAGKGTDNKNRKPFVKGSPADENSLRQMLKFFGGLLLCGFMTFLVCSMTSFKSGFLRIPVNLAVEVLILLIFHSKGVTLGTDGVIKGEILYKHLERGQEAAPGERRIPFHPFKGFLIGLGGTSVLFILAVILAATAEKQMTGPGTLPSWTEALMRRSEISAPLTAYSQEMPLSFTDFVRIAVRIMMMPFVSMAGSENRDLLLLLERLSPLIMLLPAAAFGIGYLHGPAVRTGVHTDIARSTKKRIADEKHRKETRARKETEQLN